MIVYADSSVLVRAYLPDEKGHEGALDLLNDPDLVVVTGTWTLIEVAGALVRAAKCFRGDQGVLLAAWEADTSDEGPITVIGAPQNEVERAAYGIVVEHGIRAMDAWHVASAVLMVPQLAVGEEYGFVSRDKDQAAVAESKGFRIL
ncbi:type II toxin-antitoxin system VapC family toxin [Salininema proteolyticum]|uniref:Type II toxin-antitoxin system VapC family toxin n=1 Tax=Salininema proteolyticum TaxID=1607685 RepID=A0ABV8U043_9ACTN